MLPSIHLPSAAMQSHNDATTDRDQLKQNLDEDLSQIVHDYASRGLDASAIVDSLVWHSEVAMTRTGDGETLDEHVNA